jgi:hypothetical protein
MTTEGALNDGTEGYMAVQLLMLASLNAVAQLAYLSLKTGSPGGKYVDRVWSF